MIVQEVNMPGAQRRLHKIAFGALTSLCLAFPTFGQDQINEPPQPKIIRKSGGALQESAIKRIEPIYPPLAKAARISGSVVVEVTIDEQGGIISARAASGHPLLKDAAVTAAQEWRFSPARLQGVPVKVIGTITFNFTFVDPMLIAD